MRYPRVVSSEIRTVSFGLPQPHNKTLSLCEVQHDAAISSHSLLINNHRRHVLYTYGNESFT